MDSSIRGNDSNDVCPNNSGDCYNIKNNLKSWSQKGYDHPEGNCEAALKIREWKHPPILGGCGAKAQLQTLLIF